MPNDQLIDRLVGELRPVRRRTVWGDAAILCGLGVVEIALFVAVGLIRPDMPLAMDQPSLWWKFASLASIAVVGGSVALLSFDPARSPRRGLRWLLALVVLCLGIGWAIDAAGNDAGTLVARLDWFGGVQCVAKMVFLSLPAVIGLGLLMRRGAPTDTGGTALAVGISSAAWGAFVFVFACPHDDPLYIALWYAVGCGLVTGFARLVLPILTRW